MRKTTLGAALVALFASACGGEGDALPPPQVPPPPPPPAAVAPPPAPEPAPAPPEPPKPSMLEMQKQTSQAIVAAYNAHDSKKVAELYAVDGVLVQAGVPEVKGRDAIAAEAQRAFDTFPDFKLVPTRTFAKGDVLIQEWTVTGTNKGEMNGAKPTNKAFGVRGATVAWSGPDGLIKQDHRYFDMTTMLSQLGMAKAPARPVATSPTAEGDWHVAKGTPEEDKQADVVKGFYAALDKRSEADFLGPLDDKVAWSDLSMPKDMTGKGEAKKFYGMFTKAFSDMKTTTDPLISVDDIVVTEFAINATHSGQFGPLKPTKKPVTLRGVDVLQLKDGKIVSGTSYSNSMDLLAQEGLLPKPKAPKAEAEKKDKSAGDKDKGDKKPMAEKKDEKKGDTKPASDKK